MTRIRAVLFKLEHSDCQARFLSLFSSIEKVDGRPKQAVSLTISGSSWNAMCSSCNPVLRIKLIYRKTYQTSSVGRHTKCRLPHKI